MGARRHPQGAPQRFPLPDNAQAEQGVPTRDSVTPSCPATIDERFAPVLRRLVTAEPGMRKVSGLPGGTGTQGSIG